MLRAPTLPTTGDTLPIHAITGGGAELDSNVATALRGAARWPIVDTAELTTR
jgi:hypothetical protein